MITSPGHRPAAYLGVFLLCGATLALEVVLTRVLALTMWHHFTYVVIGVALLGFGAAGTWISVRSKARRENPDGLIAGYALAAAIATPMCYLMMTRVVFHPERVFDQPLHLVSLLLIYAIIAVPFFCAGLAICAAISSYRSNVGSVYFADLLGAGCGALATPFLIEPLGGPGLIVVLGFLLAVAAACFWTSQALGTGSLLAGLFALLVLAAAGLGAWRVLPVARSGAFDPTLAPSKEMAPLQHHRMIEFTRWSPLARIDVSSEFTTVPMMGGVFRAGTAPRPLRGLFQDGAAPTMFIKHDPAPGAMDFLRHSTTGAGFPALRARGLAEPEVLAIGVGGGVDLQIALAHGARAVTGAEINATTLDLLRGRYSDYVGNLAADPRVQLVHAEGRHFARESLAQGRRFDLIQLSGVDTYTALSSGAYALSESYLYTLEAVQDFLAAITDDGLVSYSRFVFPEQPRETLRLAMTAVAALEENGVAQAHQNLFILYGDQGPYHWATVLIGRRPFAPAELAAVRGFCQENGFTVLFDPATPGQTAFDDGLRREPGARAEFFAKHPYDVVPALDERPFFFNFFKWSSLWKRGEYGGHTYKDTYPVGLLLLLVALAQTVLLGALFILRPMANFDRGLRHRTTAAALVYFSALGVGFIALEIALMQKLVLFLGHPTYALTLVLPTMLIAAGLGALTVRPLTRPRRRLRLLTVAAPILIAVTWWLVTYGIEPYLASSFTLRAVIVVAALTPVSFVLGMAFPSAVRLLDGERPELVPWAWAVNGFTSVLGSTSAVVLAMLTNFSTVILSVAVIYAVGFVTLLAGFRADAVGRGVDVVELDEMPADSESTAVHQ